MSYKRKELITLPKYLSSPLLFWWGSMLLIFLASVLSYYVSLRLSSVWWCPLRYTHKYDIRFVFTSSCLLKGSCLIYVICVCSVYSIFCFVCLVLPVSLDCSILIAPSVFANVYLSNKIKVHPSQ